MTTRILVVVGLLFAGAGFHAAVAEAGASPAELAAVALGAVVVACTWPHVISRDEEDEG